MMVGGLGQVGHGAEVQQGVAEVSAVGDGGDRVAVAGPGRDGGEFDRAVAVAGAAGGGYAGNRIQKNLQDKDTTTTTEQKCATVYDSSQKRTGFEVRYRLNGKEATVRMDHDPGDRIPVRDGQLVLDKAGTPDKAG